MNDSAEQSPKETRQDRRRRLARRLFATAVSVAIVVASVAAGGLWLFNRAFTAPGPLVEPRNVVVPRGASVRSIGTLLAEAGVVEDATVFSYGIRGFGGGRPLIAGEYAFAPAMSARDVMRLLQSGATVVRRVTVPEGLTTRQVLLLLKSAEGLRGELPGAAVIGEGTLLPETYQYGWGDRREDILVRMKEAMDETVARLWRQRRADHPLDSPEEVRILASIVERETAKADERPRIAAVFLNRLRRGMRLQSDPTVVYGLSNGLGTIGQPLTLDDLAVDHPYNTYLIDGLPPGPIANPGVASLAAVANPAETEELYFVADGNGGHVFARTLQQHNRNVARWRRIQRQRHDQ